MPLRDPRPQGSLEELQELGLSPFEYGACAEPEKDRVIGCPRYNPTRPEDGPPCPWRNGPFNLAYRKIWRRENGSGATRSTTAACYDYLRRKNQEENDTCVFEIIGREGDTVKLHGSVKQPLEPGQIVATWKNELVDHTIKPHPRARDNYQGAAELAELAKKRREARREESTDRILGVEPMGEPEPLTEDHGGHTEADTPGNRRRGR